MFPIGQKKGSIMEYQIGDIVRSKKVHPCGSKLWEITRVGIDFKLKCQGCGHVIMIPREKALKMITKLEERKEQDSNVSNIEESWLKRNVKVVIKKTYIVEFLNKMNDIKKRVFIIEYPLKNNEK